MANETGRSWGTLAGWAIVAITLILALLQLGGVASALQAQGADQERRIEALETTAVSRREVDQMHAQLDRIERKLDDDLGKR